MSRTELVLIYGALAVGNGVFCLITCGTVVAVLAVVIAALLLIAQLTQRHESE